MFALFVGVLKTSFVDIMSDMRVVHALLFFLLLLSGDVESNPGPPKKGKIIDTFSLKSDTRRER